MKKQLATSNAFVLAMGMIACFAIGQATVSAQVTNVDLAVNASVEPEGSEFVTINVKDANISEVLKAYSLQTGQSLVIGPDVVSENVNVRLNNIPWQEALDVILKPYGFGYRVVGDTIVISKLENIVTVEGIEPLSSKVFTLKYLDAYDLKEVVEAQLSNRGKISILKNKGLPGWEFGGGSQSGSDATGSQTGLGNVQRRESEEIQKSKTLIVTDVPSTITQIEKVIESLDAMPSQVLIESRFIEIATDDLMDLGLDFATGANGLTTPGVQVGNPGNNDGWGLEQNDSLGLTPAAFDAATETLNSSIPYNAGLQLLYSRIGGTDFEVLIHALEENGDVNILSAPRVLTQNNQEAAILVGEKFPIIESQNNNSGNGSGTTSTTLKYYENIGIQLNVIPQVCADDYINMIVHPVVSSIDGFESGIVSTGEDQGALTRYPRLKVREAQTQVLLKSKDTVAIGGLQNEVDRESSYGVPFLSKIPYLGRLFRRDTTTTKKIDLIIMIKATVIENESYAAQSKSLQRSKLKVMEMEMESDALADQGEILTMVKPKETAPAAAEAKKVAESSGEEDEILAMVNDEEAVMEEAAMVEEAAAAETVMEEEVPEVEPIAPEAMEEEPSSM